MYNKLQKLAKQLNIIAGVGNADVFDVDKECLLNVPFVDVTYDVRINPSLTLPGAKSIIAIGIPYNTIYKKCADNKFRGRLSSGAVGQDYHTIAKEKLDIIINTLLHGYTAMPFADTGPLIDREVAVRCGLGYIGKHYGVINSEIGSMFFIGYAITNVPMNVWNVENNSIIGSCGNCTRCIKACPTGAIKKDGFDYTKCISYITQKKGVLSNDESKSIGLQIYGCDVCQLVCPKNKFNYAESEYANPDIEKLLKISNKKFKDIYYPTAAGWRGKKILQRNAIIALGNMKDKKALDLLYEYTNDSRVEISQAAIWAVNKIKKGH